MTPWAEKHVSSIDVARDDFVMPSLNERMQEILQAVVEDYIETAEPVGSRSLTKRNRGLDLSPATVRNAMADLEDLGFLSAPHASAGRVPTALAFRLYVEKLASRNRLTPRDRELIGALAAETQNRQLGPLLQDASKVLSSLSNHASLVLLPRLDNVVFESIEFVPVRERSVLTIFVAKSGLIQQRMIEVDFPLDRDELREMSNYLRSLLDGKTLSEVRATVLSEMASERVDADALMRHALHLGERSLLHTPNPDSSVMVEGERTFLEQPEFSDLGKMRKLFRAFEEKSLVVRILDAVATRPTEAASREETAVYFGAEGNVRELKDLAAVMASYSSEGGSTGQVGVVGPIRMDYARVIPLVELTAGALSRTLGAPGADDDPDRKR